MYFANIVRDITVRPIETIAKIPNCPGIPTPNIAANAASKVTVGTTTNGTTMSMNDTEELPNGLSFTYWARATFTGPVTGLPSNPDTVEAINNPPLPEPDSYSTPNNRALEVTDPAKGLLANDKYGDSDPTQATLRVVEYTQPLPAGSGTVTVAGNGTFTYTPSAGVSNTLVTFTYRADDGLWKRDGTTPLNSAASNLATVTIAVGNVRK